MKTLVITGSPRKNGHTNRMAALFLKHLGGEVEVIEAYKIKNINPCIDCRHCWNVRECALKDGMQEIYRQIEAADNLVFASPVYFHSVPGPLKILIDRMQVYWAGHIRKDIPEKKTKSGVILLAGGAPSFPGQFEGAEMTLKSVLDDIGASVDAVVHLPDSDHESLDTRPDLVQTVIKTAEMIRKKMK